MNTSLRALDLRLLQYAQAIGIPTEPMLHLIRARRLVGNLGGWRSRRERAKQVRASSPYAGLIDKDKGFYLFGPDFIPGTAEAVAEASALVLAKQASAEEAKKPFFANVMTADDLQRCTGILALANHPIMFDAAAGYLGTYPKLRSVGVYVSEENTTLLSSQAFHYDTNDLNQVKCFINVSDVQPENGPLTFIPADLSRSLDLPWRSGRHKDEDVFAELRTDQLVALIGRAGTGAFVNTSRCLHYGSRCRKGRRIVIMAQYTPEPDLSMKAEKYTKEGMPLLLGDGH